MSAFEQARADGERAEREYVERQERVAAAERRRDELDKARTAKAQTIARAKGELLEFYRQVGAGARKDGALEHKLIEAVREAEGGVSLQAAMYPYGGGQYNVELRPVDDKAEALFEGSREALEAAEADLRSFARTNLTRLILARVTRAQEIRAETTAALQAGRKAAAAWEAERARVVTLLVQAGNEALIGEMPDNPLRGVVDAQREGALPLPVSFTLDDEQGLIR